MNQNDFVNVNNIVIEYLGPDGSTYNLMTNVTSLIMSTPNDDEFPALKCLISWFEIISGKKTTHTTNGIVTSIENKDEKFTIKVALDK